MRVNKSSLILRLVVAVMVIGVIIAVLFFSSSSGPIEGEEGVASLWIDNWVVILPRVFAVFVRNNGTVTVTIKRIVVGDEEVEWYGRPKPDREKVEAASEFDRALTPGTSASLNVVLTKSKSARDYIEAFMLGKSCFYTFTIETNRGDFKLRCGWIFDRSTHVIDFKCERLSPDY